MLLLTSQHVFSQADSVGKVRVKKNLVEIGKTYINLLDGNWFTKTYSRIDKHNWNISYTRFFKYDLFCKAQYYRILVPNMICFGKTISEYNKGDVHSTDFKSVRLSIGRRFTYKNWMFSPEVTFNHRWGPGEWIFWNWTRTTPYHEAYFETNPMKSNGFGLGVSVGYRFFNRVVLSCESIYSYNYERLHESKYMTHTSDFYTYGFQPNRKYVTAHFSVGFLF